MKKTKSRGITEIKVKLLPEKGKRDYILRMGSFIIVLVFIITNFFLVFLPSRNLTTQLNNIDGQIAQENNILNNLVTKYLSFGNMASKIYNASENKDVASIQSNQIDFNSVFSTFESLLPNHGFILNVQYSSASATYTLTVQCDTPDDLAAYQQSLASIAYVTSINRGNFTPISVPNGEPRYKATFSVTLNPSTAPKAGDSSVN